MGEISSYHGVLWELTLNENLGFGYVQIIDASIYNGWGFLVKIMNYRSEVSRKKIPLEEFNNWDMLTSPLIAAGRIPKKGNIKWQKLGTYPLSQIDLIMPICKEGGWDIEEQKDCWLVYYQKPQTTRLGGWLYSRTSETSRVLQSSHFFTCYSSSDYYGMDESLGNGF